MRTLLALLLGVVVAACVGPAAQTHSEVEPPQAASRTGAAVEPTAFDHGTRSATAPTVPPDAGYRGRLGEYADFVLGDGLVPYGSPEHLDFLANCIKSSGYNVEIVDGSLSAEFQTAQAAHYDDVQSQCEQAAIDSGLVSEIGDPSDEELAAWYKAHLLTQQCLVEKGYPTVDPPSEDSYMEAEGRNWHPYDAITDTRSAEVDCPQDLVALFERLASGSQP